MSVIEFDEGMAAAFDLVARWLRNETVYGPTTPECLDRAAANARARAAARTETAHRDSAPEVIGCDTPCTLG